MWYAGKGLKIDNVHKPLGGRIEETPTPGKGGAFRKNDTGAHLSQASIAVCMNCTSTRCSGHCEKVMSVEREQASSKHREAAKKRGYKPYRYLEYKGKLYGASELARMAGISQPAFSDRMRRGWTIEEAVETPKGGKRPRRTE